MIEYNRRIGKVTENGSDNVWIRVYREVEPEQEGMTEWCCICPGRKVYPKCKEAINCTMYKRDSEQ